MNDTEQTTFPQRLTMHQNCEIVRMTGFWILALGIVSYILPVLGIQLRLINLLANFLPFPGLLVAGLGLFLVGVAYLRDPGPDQDNSQTANPIDRD